MYLCGIPRPDTISPKNDLPVKQKREIVIRRNSNIKLKGHYWGMWLILNQDLTRGRLKNDKAVAVETSDNSSDTSNPRLIRSDSR